jgi:hypothetical protein
MAPFDLDGVANGVVDDPVAVASDTAAPVIAINGINPLTIEVGRSYADAYATVTDNVDATNNALAGVSTVNTSRPGIYTVTYDYTDTAGNPAARKVRTVTARDTTPPAFALAALPDVTLESAGVATPYAFVTPGVTDAYGVASVVVDNSGPFALGTTTVTWTATDLAGLTTTKSQNVVVTDTIAPAAPVIVAPVDGYATNNITPTVAGTAEANSTVDLYAEATIHIGTATADAAGNWSITLAATAEGTYSLTARATDSSGNVSAVSTAVSATIDTTAPAQPVITSPADGVATNRTRITLTGTAEANSTVEFFSNNVLIGSSPADASGGWSIIISATFEGFYSLTAKSTDAAGNTSAISTPVRIMVDRVAPVIAINGANPATAELAQAYADAYANVTDNVDAYATITGVSTVNTAVLGSYTVTYDYTDTAGNPAVQKIRTVNVVDTTPPAFDLALLPDVTLEATGVTTPCAFITPGVTDAYGVASVVVDNLGPFSIGTTTVTWIATDDTGLTTTKNQNVVVTDTTPPAFDLALLPDVTLEATGVTTPYAFITPGVTDAYGVASVVVDNLGPFSIGTTTVTWTATDDTGLTTTKNQNVVVTDTTPPAFDLAALPDVNLEATGVTTPYAFITPGVTDAYGVASVVVDNLGPFSIGTTTVTWTATDDTGLTTTKNQNVVVTDTTPPAFDLAALPDVTLEATGVTTPYAFITPGVTDAYGVASVVVDNSGPFSIGTTTVTWTATDDTGLTTTKSQNVIVTDTTPPAFDQTVLPDVTLEATGVTTPYAFITPGVTDAYGVASVVVDNLGPFSIGTTTVTWTATDDTGLTTTSYRHHASCI